ncbi:MAG TPA: hypothetical protein DCM28_05225 [Phycisphaerales bacterium]|nr:hypothetical protein [Phycisphaerales bacterium]HCD31119.1 hypothetical protein [Phycisphaerales bacterium]|tara:strand:- start:1342 stop:1608 length:267 start_codon:yes stop_codon:yes gene_type:complete
MTDIARCPFCGGDLNVHKPTGTVWHGVITKDGVRKCVYQAPSLAAHNKLAREAEVGRKAVELSTKGEKLTASQVAELGRYIRTTEDDQ